MKKILFTVCIGAALLASSCVKTYNCDCYKTLNGVPTDTFIHTGDGRDHLDVCNAADATTISGNDTTNIDCEPQ